MFHVACWGCCTWIFRARLEAWNPAGFHVLSTGRMPTWYISIGQLICPFGNQFCRGSPTLSPWFPRVDKPDVRRPGSIPRLGRSVTLVARDAQVRPPPLASPPPRPSPSRPSRSLHPRLRLHLAGNNINALPVSQTAPRIYPPSWDWRPGNWAVRKIHARGCLP